MKLFKIVHKPDSKAHVSVSEFDGDVSSPEGHTVTVVPAPTPLEAVAQWKVSVPEVPPAAITAQINAKHAAEMERCVSLLQEEALGENLVRSPRSFEKFMELDETDRWRALFYMMRRAQPAVVEEGKVRKTHSKPD